MASRSEHMKHCCCSFFGIWFHLQFMGWACTKETRWNFCLGQEEASKIFRRNYKFGIDLPKTVENALTLDAKNDDTFWADAIAKEMENARMALKIHSRWSKAPIGFWLVWCHMVLCIKMEDFRCKAQLVVGTHMTKAQATLMYTSIVVSRETVCMDCIGSWVWQWCWKDSYNC